MAWMCGVLCLAVAGYHANRGSSQLHGLELRWQDSEGRRQFRSLSAVLKATFQFSAPFEREARARSSADRAGGFGPETAKRCASSVGWGAKRVGFSAVCEGSCIPPDIGQGMRMLSRIGVTSIVITASRLSSCASSEMTIVCASLPAPMENR